MLQIYNIINLIHIFMSVFPAWEELFQNVYTVRSKNLQLSFKVQSSKCDSLLTAVKHSMSTSWKQLFEGSSQAGQVTVPG